MDELKRAAENIRLHFGSLGVSPDQIERFITDILRQTIQNELNKTTER
jgi:hypothetical protein